MAAVITKDGTISYKTNDGNRHLVLRSAGEIQGRCCTVSFTRNELIAITFFVLVILAAMTVGILYRQGVILR